MGIQQTKNNFRKLLLKYTLYIILQAASITSRILELEEHPPVANLALFIHTNFSQEQSPATYTTSLQVKYSTNHFKLQTVWKPSACHVKWNKKSVSQ